MIRLPRGGPIGVLLAGGDGRRLGGDKPRVELAGRPLAHYALDALCEVLDEVVVACRLDTDLPPLPRVREAWVEPAGPRSPLAGIVSALREARGRPIVACALSLPLVTPHVLHALSSASSRSAATIPHADGRLQPLVARWEHTALRTLEGLPAEMPLDTAVRLLDPAILPMDHVAECFLRVDVPEDLLRAGAALDARRRRARAMA